MTTTPFDTAPRSLADRMRRAALLDAATYEAVEHDTAATGQAAVVVALAAVAAAVGDVWRSGGPGLFSGLVGSLAGWAVWSGIAYFIGTRLFGGRATWGELLRTLGFAQAPGVLLVFAIVPLLGGLVKGIIGVWLLATGFVALRQALDLSVERTLLTALVGWVALVVVRMLIGATLGVPLY